MIVGVVMANGFPIAHHVLAGNQSQKTTFQDVLTEVDRRFGLERGRVIVVADCGLVSAENLDDLSKSTFRYLLGIPTRRCQEAVSVFEALDDTV